MRTLTTVLLMLLTVPVLAQGDGDYPPEGGGDGPPPMGFEFMARLNQLENFYQDEDISGPASDWFEGITEDVATEYLEWLPSQVSQFIVNEAFRIKDLFWIHWHASNGMDGDWPNGTGVNGYVGGLSKMQVALATNDYDLFYEGEADCGDTWGSIVSAFEGYYMQLQIFGFDLEFPQPPAYPIWGDWGE